MSNMDLVTELVEAQREATVETVFAAIQLMPEEDRISRMQVAAALHNARNAEMIKYLRSNPRPTKHSRRPMVYGPMPKVVDTSTWKRPVSFVFDLGRPA